MAAEPHIQQLTWPWGSETSTPYDPVHEHLKQGAAPLHSNSLWKLVQNCALNVNTTLTLAMLGLANP